MKKYFLSIIAIISFGIVIVSCQNNNQKKSEVKDSSSTAQNDVITAVASNTPNHANDKSIPTFKNEEVAKYCREYKALVDEYSEAIKNNKSINEAELSDRVRELSAKAQGLQVKMQPEEIEKFAMFITSISNQLAQISIKNSQNESS